MQNPVDLSIVIPLLNEEESLIPLTDWIFKTFEKLPYRYEILFIDDGSTDGSWEIIKQLSTKQQHIKGICFAKNYGKSQALHAGFEAANGTYVVTLDAHLQDSPAEIPQMIDQLKDGYELISWWKKQRSASIFFKNLPSTLVN